MKMTRGIGTSINTKLLRIMGAVALFFCCSGTTLAVSIEFSPSPSVVAPSDTVDIDIFGIGFADPLAGGFFDLGFDSAIVQINSVTIDPVYEFLPDGGGLISPGLWGTVAFDTFSPTPPTGDIRIATVNLTVLGPGTSNLVILSSAFFDDTVNQYDPTLVPGVISSVPVPAAVWLFGSGLLGLIGIARRKTV